MSESELYCGFLSYSQKESLFSPDYRIREQITSNLVISLKTFPTNLIKIDEFLKLLETLLRDPNMKVVQNSHIMLKTLMTSLDQNCILYASTLVKMALNLYTDNRRFVRRLGSETITHLLKFLSPTTVISEIVRVLNTSQPQVAVECLAFIDSLVQYNTIPSVLLTQFTFFLNNALSSPHKTVQQAAANFLRSLEFRDPSTYSNIIGNFTPESIQVVKQSKEDIIKRTRRASEAGKNSALVNSGRTTLNKLFKRVNTTRHSTNDFRGSTFNETSTDYNNKVTNINKRPSSNFVINPTIDSFNATTNYNFSSYDQLNSTPNTFSNNKLYRSSTMESFFTEKESKEVEETIISPKVYTDKTSFSKTLPIEPVTPDLHSDSNDYDSYSKSSDDSEEIINDDLSLILPKYTDSDQDFIDVPTRVDEEKEIYSEKEKFSSSMPVNDIVTKARGKRYIPVPPRKADSKKSKFLKERQALKEKCALASTTGSIELKCAIEEFNSGEKQKTYQVHSPPPIPGKTKRRPSFLKKKELLSPKAKPESAKKLQSPRVKFNELFEKLHSSEWSDQNDAILAFQTHIDEFYKLMDDNSREMVHILAECGCSIRTMLAKNSLSLLLIMIKDTRIDCTTAGEAAGASLLHIVSAGRQFISAIACDCFDCLVECMNPTRASAMLVAESKRKQDKARIRVAFGIGIIAPLCPNDTKLKNTCQALMNDANQDVRRTARESAKKFPEF